MSRNSQACAKRKRKDPKWCRETLPCFLLLRSGQCKFGSNNCKFLHSDVIQPVILYDVSAPPHECNKWDKEYLPCPDIIAGYCNYSNSDCFYSHEVIVTTDEDGRLLITTNGRVTVGRKGISTHNNHTESTSSIKSQHAAYTSAAQISWKTPKKSLNCGRKAKLPATTFGKTKNNEEVEEIGLEMKPTAETDPPGPHTLISRKKSNMNDSRWRQENLPCFNLLRSGRCRKNINCAYLHFGLIPAGTPCPPLGPSGRSYEARKKWEKEYLPCPDVIAGYCDQLDNVCPYSHNVVIGSFENGELTIRTNGRITVGAPTGITDHQSTPGMGHPVVIPSATPRALYVSNNSSISGKKSTQVTTSAETSNSKKATAPTTWKKRLAATVDSIGAPVQMVPLSNKIEKYGSGIGQRENQKEEQDQKEVKKPGTASLPVSMTIDSFAELMTTPSIPRSIPYWDTPFIQKADMGSLNDPAAINPIANIVQEEEDNGEFDGLNGPEKTNFDDLIVPGGEGSDNEDMLKALEEMDKISAEVRLAWEGIEAKEKKHQKPVRKITSDRATSGTMNNRIYAGPLAITTDHRSATSVPLRAMNQQITSVASFQPNGPQSTTPKDFSQLVESKNNDQQAEKHATESTKTGNNDHERNVSLSRNYNEGEVSTDYGAPKVGHIKRCPQDTTEIKRKRVRGSSKGEDGLRVTKK